MPPDNQTLGQYAEQTLEGMITNPTMYILPMMIGIFLDALFLGITWYVALIWYKSAGKADSSHVRILILYLLLVTTGISFWIVVWAMKAFVYGFGNYANYISLTASYGTWMYIPVQLVRIPATVFYVTRAFRLLRGGALGWTYMVLTAVGYGGAVAGTITGKIFSYDPLTRMNRSEIAWFLFLGGDLLSELLTSGVIWWQLYRSRMLWASTDRLGSRITLLVHETMTPPTLLSVTYLVMYGAAPTDLVCTCLLFATKWYTVCLIASLNAKHGWKVKQESASRNSGSWTGTMSEMGSATVQKTQNQNKSKNQWTRRKAMPTEILLQMETHVRVETVDEYAIPLGINRRVSRQYEQSDDVSFVAHSKA